MLWYVLTEAIVIVREREGGNILDVVNQFEGLTLSLLRIPDSEDWGTADSLRCLKERGKLKVKQFEEACDCNMLSIIIFILTIRLNTLIY